MTMDVPAPPPIAAPDRRHRAVDPTALSFWFPKIAAAGLPVPRTKFFKMPDAAQEAVFAMFDGKSESSALIDFAVEVAEGAVDLGYPFFLRTDHTSAKHGWERSCFVTMAEEVPSHIFEIIEYSEMSALIGVPWDTWVAREMLPTIPLTVCPNFGNMPLCREFRCFVDGATIKCVHPYWPRHAIEQGGASLTDAQYDYMCGTSDIDEIRALASRAGAAVGGAWSVDILETKRGWFVTDMAEAHKSFHWEGCANAEEMRATRRTRRSANEPEGLTDECGTGAEAQSAEPAPSAEPGPSS